MASALSRGALVVLALVVGGWLVLSYRSAELEQEAQGIIAGARDRPPSGDELRHGMDLLADAGRLNADKSPDLNEALLLAAAKRPKAAVAQVEQVLAEEPDNFDGWFFMYVVARDRAHAARALREMRALDPTGADAVRDLRRSDS